MNSGNPFSTHYWERIDLSAQRFKRASGPAAKLSECEQNPATLERHWFKTCATPTSKASSAATAKSGLTPVPSQLVLVFG